MKKDLTVMNFSHVYENETFYTKEDFNWIDCSSIEGTNGYCDDEALNELEQRIEKFDADGFHFIDSGNYHYISGLWMEKIKRDFMLIVFDHHSDMIRPSFGDILSCGSWVMNALDNNSYLKKVILIGLSNEQIETIPEKYKDKVKTISEDDLLKIETWQKLRKLKSEIPVYISIDKDVLDKNIVDTCWNQGKMSFDEMKRILHIIIDNQDIIGVDICGENNADNMKALSKNDEFNKEIVDFLREEEYSDVKQDTEKVY